MTDNQHSVRSHVGDTIAPGIDRESPDHLVPPLPSSGDQCTYDHHSAVVDEAPDDADTAGADLQLCEQQQGSSVDAGTQELHLRLEAFGSGKVLHNGLIMPSDSSVGDLRKHVRSAITVPPRTRIVRLFVGHGGTELDNDELLLSGTPVLQADLDNEPLVVFPALCTLCCVVCVRV